MQKCLTLNKYSVVYTLQATKQLEKMDKYTRKFIYAWIEKNLQGCENPRLKGKSLTANRSGEWRYRIGDYRLITEIQDDKIIILVFSVGHRRVESFV